MNATLPSGSGFLEPDGDAPQAPEPRDRLRAVLHALSDPVRLEMVRRLRDAGTDQACAALYDDLPKSTASYHFATLRACGLIEQHTAGGRRLNRLRAHELDRLAPGLLDIVLAVP